MKTTNGFQASGVSFLTVLFFAAAFTAFAMPETPDFGADTLPDLFSPDLAGQGSFVTSTGSAPFSAINPAQGGQMDRMILNFGALGVTNLNIATELGGIIDVGFLYPAKSVTYSGTLRYYYFDQFTADFPLKRELGGNFSIAKEFRPQFSLGGGINFGAGTDNWTISADLGLLQNLGDLGFLKNFSWAFVMRNMGISWAPTWFTPWAGVSFDFLQIKGKGGKPDPLVLKFAADVGLPSIIALEEINLIVKTGITATLFEKVTLSILWPGAGGYNMRESGDGNRGHFQPVPSVGIGINFIIPSGGKRQPGERHPSDGKITFDAAFKPLYYDVYATGAGVTWYVGYKDNLPPNIIVDYPEVQYISPNNDEKASSLVFPVKIEDDHYVASWIMTIKDSDGNIVRTYRNKDRRPEMNNYGNSYMEKKGVEVPPAMQWDGTLDTGGIVPDGKYYFSISASDGNGNVGTSPSYEVIIKDGLQQPREKPQPQPRGTTRSQPQSRDGGTGSGRTGSASAVLTASTNAIAPEAGQTSDLVRFTARLTRTEGISSWKLEIKDDKGAIVKIYQGRGGRLPESFSWNGLSDNGSIREGMVYPELTVNYLGGNVANAKSDPILVDSSGPVLDLSSAPDLFSPDNDGVDDVLTIRLKAEDVSPIARWSLDIYEPVMGNGTNPVHIFKHFEGSGAPVRELIWDGRGNNGDLVQSAVDYPYVYTAVDALGNTSAKRGTFGTDLMGFWEGDQFRMHIPSIMFPADSAVFDGLNQSTLDNNNRIIKSIAQMLNKFSDYKVMIEGHANPTTASGPAREEEEPSLKDLSEKRAEYILEQLVRNSVDRNRLSFSGAGGSMPIVPFEDHSSWWKNRRVDFILLR